VEKEREFRLFRRMVLSKGSLYIGSRAFAFIFRTAK
jgi:hypothetical protein